MNHRLFIPAVLAALAAAVAGCTSDLPNEVGADLGTVVVDSVLIPLDLGTFADYSALAIEDPDVPLSRQQVLYLGGQNGTRSSILVNFDFANYFNEDFPESLFTAGNINSVKLSLTKLTFYGEAADTTREVPQVYYHVHTLTAPFDSTAYPGPVPLYNGRELNADYTLEQGDEPLIPLYVPDFLEWIASGDTIGFLIQAGAESDSGLVGFAARDLVRLGEIPAVAVGTVPAPNFVVDFLDQDTNHLIPPVADISTFHAVSPPSADGSDELMLRTCLRQVPTLLYDLGGLPAGAYINRAVLVLHNDTSRSFGTLQTLVVSELDQTLFGDPVGSLTLDELGAGVYQVTGMVNIEPDYNERFDFNVTTSVQRHVNGAYDGVRGFVITADEDFFPAYDRLTIDPDFYFNELRFHGTAAADSLRPRLQINYSVIVPEGGASHE